MSDLQQLARNILRSASAGSAAFRTAATILTFSDDAEVSNMCARDLRASRWLPDDELLLRMYESGNKRERMALLRYPMLFMIRPVRFRRLFSHAWQTYRRAPDARALLASLLRGFLMRNPAESHVYSRYLRALLADRAPRVRLRGIELAGFLTGATRREVTVVESALYSAGIAEQDAALMAVWFAAGWDHRVSEAMAQMMMSPRLLDRIESAGKRRDGIGREWLVHVRDAIVSWREAQGHRERAEGR